MWHLEDTNPFNHTVRYYGVLFFYDLLWVIKSGSACAAPLCTVSCTSEAAEQYRTPIRCGIHAGRLLCRGTCRLCMVAPPWRPPPGVHLFVQLRRARARTRVAAAFPPRAHVWLAPMGCMTRRASDGA
jgi:hypothetical protein